MRHYVLGADGEPVVGPADVESWARMFDWSSTDRIVAKTDIDGEVEVSTVFLGLDHAVWDGPPMLFETMIFGGPHDNSQWRYTLRKQAQAGHDAIVAALRAGRDPYTIDFEALPLGDSRERDS